MAICFRKSEFENRSLFSKLGVCFQKLEFVNQGVCLRKSEFENRNLTIQ